MCNDGDYFKGRVGVRGKVWYREHRKKGVPVPEGERGEAGFKAQLCH